MNIEVDLHLHSTASDGVFEPEVVVRHLAAAGLRAIALTDHDTVDGVERASAEAAKVGIDFISGIELSTTDGRREIHILGYGIDPAHPALEAHRQKTYVIRRDRLIRMVDRLRASGHAIELEAVLAGVGDGMPARPHLARAMVEAGIVADVSEAFRMYLSEGGAAFIPKPLPGVREAIELVHTMGGAAVLAHPAHDFTDHDIRALVRVGLDGVETSHPSHTPDLEAYYRSRAEMYGLIATGGSDYHGARENDREMLGRFGTSLEVLRQLRSRAHQHSLRQQDTCHAS